MRGPILISLFILTCSHSVNAQDFTPATQSSDDSLHAELIQLQSSSTPDTSYVNVLNQLSHYHKFRRPDSGVYYATKALAFAREIEFTRGELDALHVLALSYRTLSNYSKALQINLEGLRLAELYELIHPQGRFRFNVGIIRVLSGDYEKGLSDLRESIAILESTEYELSILAENWMGKAYSETGRMDSAVYYCHRAYAKAVKTDFAWVIVWPAKQLGEVHYHLQNSDSAHYYFQEAIKYAHWAGVIGSNAALSRAKLFYQANQNDSSAFYAHLAFETAIAIGLLSESIDACLFLTELYKETDLAKALDYNEMAIVYNDSLEQLRQNTTFGDIFDFDTQQRQYEVESTRSEFQSRLRINALLGSSFTLLVIAFFLYRNNRNKQKSKRKIEEAYDRLKATQSQLIQSEKMASLGELTAGIAHEIQNPLNFVNNFSDLNTELVEELREELKKGNKQEAEAIIKDIEENEQKILHHGKRADGIVKGMLQHSRAGGGEKELTDINELADEYLRLSYHGLRAKDKSFNADFKTELDPDLPIISVVPQDIGRVLLNLINNAFFAVSVKTTPDHPEPVEGSEGVEPESHASSASALNTGDYKPTVTVSTKLMSPSGGGKGEVQISVKDNGSGIPDFIKDKIFQPFFTTKSTGEGTGLGLSLSYDIVTKGHGGELKVETEEGKGTTFLIILPV